MGTDFFAQGIGNFFLYKVAEGEGGYNYYGRLHRTGRVLIVREKTDGTEVKYADGGFGFDASCAGRTGLNYKSITEL